jgi:L-arabinokinase
MSNTGINKPARICYYVTGHGLGHATRSLLVISRLIQSGVFVDIVSALDPSIFVMHLHRELGIVEAENRFNCHQRSLDTGAVQAHALKVDPLETLRRYESIHAKHDDLVAFEAEFLRNRSVGVVLIDATPIACRAAKLAGAKVVLLSNFSWDYCYRGMLDEVISCLNADSVVQRYSSMIDECSMDYCDCDLYLQLPGKCAPPPQFDARKVVEGPLVARRAKQSREETLAQYGIAHTADTKVLLVGFGGHATAWNLQETSLPDGWLCLVLGAEDGQLPKSERFIPIDFNCFVPDLIAASDVMLGKLGYGLVSECLSAGTPLIYVPRSSWPEECCLEVFLLEHSGGLRMPGEDFFSGKWSEYLQRALDLSDDKTSIRFSPPMDAVYDIFAHERMVDLIGTNLLA